MKKKRKPNGKINLNVPMTTVKGHLKLSTIIFLQFTNLTKLTNNNATSVFNDKRIPRKPYQQLHFDDKVFDI